MKEEKRKQRREERKKRKKKSGWKKFFATFFTILLVLTGGVLLVINIFVIDQVVVTGNEHYQDEVIQQWILNDEYSWNTLYVYLKYRFQEPQEIPFVDTMEITIKNPRTIEIQVYEKGILGYVYLDSFGQNVYFDKDGIVVETSSKVMEGVPQITGLSVGAVVLYEKLPLEEKNILKDLLSLTRTLKKYQIFPENIVYQKKTGNFVLEYDNIQVFMGMTEHINDKVLRISYILPELKGKTGILHLESWTGNTTDIIFEETEKQ